MGGECGRLWLRKRGEVVEMKRRLRRTSRILHSFAKNSEATSGHRRQRAVTKLAGSNSGLECASSNRIESILSLRLLSRSCSCPPWRYTTIRTRVPGKSFV